MVSFVFCTIIFDLYTVHHGYITGLSLVPRIFPLSRNISNPSIFYSRLGGGVIGRHLPIPLACGLFVTGAHAR